MKIALTGATGFIGRYVLDRLIKLKFNIVAVTRNSEKLKYVNEFIEVIELDLNTDCDFYKIMGEPDVLIHLAWDGLPHYKSLYHFEIELPLQYNFIKRMVESGLKTLFVSGTCFEYGMQSGELDVNKKTEPINAYGYSKDALRKQLEYLKINKSFNLIWGRLFYMYGEGQASQSLYSQLKQAVINGDKIFNMSGGKQLRDYLPVETVAEMIVDLSVSQKDVGLVNICAGKPILLHELVEHWIKVNEWIIELNLGYYPYPDYEPMEYWGDSKKLKELTLK